MTQQAATQKLSVEIGTMADLLESHPATRWKHNIKPFLRNQAKAVPFMKPWRWLIKVWQSGRYDIQAPMAFVKAILANPWYRFPDEKVHWDQLKKTYYPGDKKREEKREREYSTNNTEDSDVNLSSPLPSADVRETSGHPIECGCVTCHLEDVQAGVFECRGGEFCAPCRMLGQSA